jgi:hypothetical protein
MLKDEEKTEIKNFYQTGKGSIQDLARIYRVSVDEVLEVIGEKHLSSVRISGDMIDPTEAGPGAQLNYGSDVVVPFTTN